MVILEGIERQKRFRTTLHHVYPAWISILPGVKDIVAKDKWKYNAGSQMDRPNAHVFEPLKKSSSAAAFKRYFNTIIACFAIKD